MIDHVIDAAIPAAMAGFSIEIYELSRTLGKAVSDIRSVFKDGRRIYFTAFEKTWLPAWQFDFEVNRIRPSVHKVLQHFKDKQIIDPLQIMGWANQPSELLGGIKPAQWISEKRSNQMLLRSIDEFDSADLSTLPAPLGKQEPIKRDQTKDIKNVSAIKLQDSIRLLEQITDKPHILIQVLSFLQVFPDIDPSISWSNDKYELHDFGSTLVTGFIPGYIPLGSFIDELTKREKHLPVVNDTTAEWLGVAAARMTQATILWLDVIGPMISETDLLDCLDLDESNLEIALRDGKLFRITSDDRNWYPRWQFEARDKEGSERPFGRIRAVVSEILDVLRFKEDMFGPYEISSWAGSPNEELSGLSPASWLEEGRDPNQVLYVAQQLAAYTFQ